MTREQILKRAYTNVKYLPCDKFTLLRIPKTGHTSMIEAFDLGQTTDPSKINPPLVAVIRHPVDRFLSGFQQCIKTGSTNSKTVTELLDEIEDLGFFNEHLVPMWCFWDERVENVYTLENIGKFEIDFNTILLHLNKSESHFDISKEDYRRIRIMYRKDFELYRNCCRH